MQRKTVSLLVALLLLSAIPLNVSADENDDIPTNASSTGVHNSLVAALAHADLVTTLQGDGPFTVFAPTDDAFDAAGIDLADYNDDEMNSTLSTILLYHVYAGQVLAADVTDGLTVNMVNGLPATFGVADGVVTVGDATVTTADVISSNGVIHVIDTVLIPTQWQIMAVDGMSMFDTDGDSMVSWDEFDAFIATDGGWDSDEERDTSSANFNQADSNGDMLLDLNELAVFAELDNQEMPDIPSVASETGIHESLVAAVVQAELLETLQSDGPFTVFAPTDDAFADAGIDLSDFETEEGLATLADILLYHVASGEVTSDMLSDGMVATMVNQDDVTFTVNSDGVMVNDATVIMADVGASNGVIHVIDKVLMPPADVEGEICYNLNTHTIVAGASQAECDAYMYVVDYEIDGQSVTGCYNGVTHAVADVSQEVCESYVWTAAVDIASTASATTIHNSLVAALAQAELVATLSGVENYTVFAPTDEAFAAAGIDLSDPALTQDVLANILLYHVVPGTIMSSDLSVGTTTVTAANGDSLLVHVTDSGVMVGTEMAVVTLADVPASNGVIHVIDKVIMPPADAVTCDVTIGISSDGYAFSPAAVTIDVDQTVCWSWTDSSMSHNVKEVDGMKSNTFVDGGITSGAPSKTVDFYHTFTEDTIFYYACEPHISVDMFGKITVGDGGVEPSSDDDDDDSENNTPGFLGVTMIMATLGAVLFARSNRDEE